MRNLLPCLPLNRPMILLINFNLMLINARSNELVCLFSDYIETCANFFYIKIFTFSYE